VNQDPIRKLSYEERKDAVAWLAEHRETAPASVRPWLKEIFDHLTAGVVSQKEFNVYARLLARALGLIPSTERRHSGDPLTGFKPGQNGKPKTERERLEQERDQSTALADRYRDLEQKQRARLNRSDARLREIADESQMDGANVIDIDTPVEEIELSEAEKAESAAYARQFVERLELGNGADPALQSASETLMNGSVVSNADDEVSLPVELPKGVDAEDVIKTLTDTRVRYDISMTVTRVELDVEKKVVVAKDGKRQVISASTSEYGPPHYAVTWNALATVAVLVGQFAMPMHRLATMLSTAVKHFTAGSLTRMVHYVAERFIAVYLELAEELADSEIMGGDDTSCRVVEVSSYLTRSPKQKPEPAPWAGYRTVEVAEKSYGARVRCKEMLLALRKDGEREAKDTPILEPSLCIQVGRELTFESSRRDGNGPKQSLNTTVMTGRSVAGDPKSLIVFYRSHLGSLGNLLEMLLKKRKASARKLTVQSDLSTTNLVTDPELCSRFEIELAGCTSHARRPFALYEDQDPVHVPYMLHLFKGLALCESRLDRHGRNRENVLAVRGTNSREIWDKIKGLSEKMVKKWTQATPLGTAARYIVKHFEKLTAYLRNPFLDATNNLRERLLRTEKLIEKSSMFRLTIEGRVVLDIVRTVLQTAVAAGVPVQEYLVDVMRAKPEDVTEHPERYTPRAWAARQAAAPIQIPAEPASTPSSKAGGWRASKESRVAQA
jgi:hypothetical protein